MATIDYSALGKAVQRLKEGLEALTREPENSLYRDAVIQRFEFTYGLCASMMKRHLAQTAAVEPEREITFPALIRTASENGLLRSTESLDRHLGAIHNIADGRSWTNSCCVGLRVGRRSPTTSL